MKFLENWKKEWLEKHEKSLCEEFDSEIQKLKDSFSKTISEWNQKKQELLKQIELESQALSLQQNEYAIILKKLERSQKSIEDQIRILEAKASPANVWTDAFSLGFSKAWDMMLPIMSDGLNKLKKSIEDKAIQDTLERMNGHHKTHN